MSDVNKQLLDAAKDILALHDNEVFVADPWNDSMEDLRQAIAAAEQAQQQAEPVAGIERVVKKLRYYGEVTDGRIDNPERKLMREAADMLAAQPPAVAVAVPDGYALVPIEPTLAMLAVGQQEWLDSAGADPSFDIYRSMVAFAQKP